jgi:hypothetical protein
MGMRAPLCSVGATKVHYACLQANMYTHTHTHTHKHKIYLVLGINTEMPEHNTCVLVYDLMGRPEQREQWHQGALAHYGFLILGICRQVSKANDRRFLHFEVHGPQQAYDGY